MGIFRGTGGTGDSTTDTTVTTVTEKAAEAASSATSAADSATSAANSASSASTSEANAATLETNAATSATNSATSATNSATSATSASTSATTATTKASEASTSATNAATSATAAQTAQTAAEAAQTAAETAETNAETAEANTLAIFGDAQDVQDAVDDAEKLAINPEDSQYTLSDGTTTGYSALHHAAKAEDHKTAAEVSKNAAETAETAAETAQGLAETAKTAAETAQSAAETAQAAAELAQSNAETVYDDFDDRYLGTKSGDPLVDNDNEGLTTGTLYFNTTENEMRVYTGTAWIAVVDLAGDITVNSLTSNNDVVVKGNLEVQGTTITVDSATAQTIDLGDNDKIRFGDGDDLQVYHDGTDSYIANTTGTLKLSGNTDVTGNITVSGTVDGRDIATDGATLDAVASTYVDVSGDTLTGDLAFGDNVKAKFGASNDLQIYHDGSNSYVQEIGTGELLLRTNGARVTIGTTSGEYMGRFEADSFVKLYYDNAEKLATTSSGVDVTGTLVSDGLTVNDGESTTVTIGSSGVSTDSSELFLKKGFAGTSKLDFLNSGSNYSVFRINVDSAENVSFDWDYESNISADRNISFTSDATKTHLNISTTGDISFYEDTGTTAKLTWDASAEELQFKDDVAAEFGDGGDFRIFHNNVNAKINNNTGALQITNFSDNSDVTISTDDGSGDTANYFRADGSTGEAILYHYGSEKLATKSTGIDVTGTVTADGATIDGTLNVTSNALNLNSSSPAFTITDSDTSAYHQLSGASGYGSLYLTVDRGSSGLGGGFYIQRNANVPSLLIANSTGDISFYDDAGTSQDFYWDASTSRLGLGTTSPSKLLEVDGDAKFVTTSGVGLQLHNDSSNQSYIQFTNTVTGETVSSGFQVGIDGTEEGLIWHYRGEPIKFATNNTERMRIDSSGRLGIGTTSPSYNVEIADASAGSVGPVLYLHNSVNSVSTGHAAEIRFNLRESEAVTRNAVIRAVSTSSYGSDPDLLFLTSSTSTGNPEERMRITSGGNVGIGTTSPSAPLQVKTSSSNAIRVTRDGAENQYLELNESDGSKHVIKAVNGAGASKPFEITNDWGDIRFRTSASSGADSEAMRIDSSGNLGLGISNPSAQLHLSKAGGTLVKLGTSQNTCEIEARESGAANILVFSSNNSVDHMALADGGLLGIGTASPSAKLHIQDSAPTLLIYSDTTTGGTLDFVDQTWQSQIQGVGGGLAFKTGGTTESMRLNYQGRLGIGTTSPDGLLHISSGTGGSAIVIIEADTNNNDEDEVPQLWFKADGDITEGVIRTNDNELQFISNISSNSGFQWLLGSTNNTGTTDPATGASEVMRIDSSGNLLVGKTAVAQNNEGVELRSTGLSIFTKADSNAIKINRTGSDGDIAIFSKGGSNVGSIGVDYSDNLFLSGNSSHSGLLVGTESIAPYADGAARDASEDLGTTTARWRNLYLSGGVYLGGTGSANLLDDYEEGTWTPVVEGLSTAGSTTYTLQVGRYTKIGNIVYLRFEVRYSSHTGTGGFIITGLPFPAVLGSGWPVLGVPSMVNQAFTGDYPLFYVEAGQSRLRLYGFTNNAGQSASSIDASTGIEINLNGTYRTSA